MRKYTDHVEEPVYNGKTDIKNCSKNNQSYEIGLKGECFEVNKLTGKKLKSMHNSANLMKGNSFGGKLMNFVILLTVKQMVLFSNFLLKRKIAITQKKLQSIM